MPWDDAVVKGFAELDKMKEKLRQSRDLVINNESTFCHGMANVKSMDVQEAA
jgi:hypothetical protein